MDTLLRDYEDWLLGKRLATSTILNYTRRLRSVLSLCEQREWDILDLTVAQIRWVAAQFSPGKSSQALVKCALIHFYDMAGVSGPVDAIQLPPTPPARYRGLEPGDAARLERAALEAGWPRGTIVLIGLYLGLRRAEIVQMRWTDFDDKLEWVTITGKGRRTRHIPVAPILRRVLRDRRVGTGWLFPSDTPNRAYIHTHTVRNWLYELCERAGIDPISPHQMRHTCLGFMNDATGDIRTVQEFAGHARIESTIVYTRASKTKLQAAVASLHYEEDAA